MRATQKVAFEDAIVDWLVTHGGYTRGVPTNYDPAVALDTAEFFTFIGATEADEWVAYFRPASGLNPDLEAKYAANRLTVIRQLHYAPEHANALDLALFVNGLPAAPAELKNPLTHQTVEHAMAQYRTDRDPRDALLGRRAIVHFAVDPHLVMMTTKLERRATRFLPFNRGSDPDATACGAGNRPNHDGYATSYLWERVWERHAWLDIRFGSDDLILEWLAA